MSSPFPLPSRASATARQGTSPASVGWRTSGIYVGYRSPESRTRRSSNEAVTVLFLSEQRLAGTSKPVRPVGRLERMLLGDVRGWGCGRCSGRWR